MRSRLLRQAAPAIVLLLMLVPLAQGCAPAAQPAESPTTNAPVAWPATATAEAGPAPAQAATGGSFDGHWEGAVDAAGQKVITKVDFKTDGDKLTGTVSFPQQNAMNLKLDQVSRQGDKVHFEAMPSPRTAIFDGTLQGSDKITGTFKQATFTGTFELARTQAAQAKPTQPLPYKAEEVKFQNGAITLAGTLTVPEGKGPFPAVVLITGSGPENRDEEIFGFKIFGVLADYLTRQGIAVLRYDDRGVGGSTAGTPEDTSVTFAGDVAAAVQYLKGRTEINPKQIGLLGHSEGGIIAPLVAVQSPDVAFIILMSGPGTPGSQVLQDQQKLIAKASGKSDAEIATSSALQKRVIDAALTGQGWDAVKTDMAKEFQTAAAALPEDQRKQLGDVNQWTDQMVQTQVKAMDGAWMKYFLAHDPAPTLEKVQVPVLALFGGRDLQVPPESNKTAVMNALDKGGNKDHTAKVFPDANHLYQSAVTGSPSEYATLKPEFTAGFLETISQWILAHTD